MKLSFTFTQTADLKSTPRDERYVSNIEIPDQAQLLIGYEERINKIVESIATFTDTALHFTCKEMGIKDQFIKDAQVTERERSIHSDFKVTVFVFEALKYRRRIKRQIKVHLPKLPGTLATQRTRQKGSLSKNLFWSNRRWCQNDADHAYMDMVETLSTQMLMLLNADPEAYWEYKGFNPLWIDNRLINRFNNRVKRIMKEEKKKAREAKKTSKKAPHPKTGAGRRPGAIPGEFMGVKFRSQLEIRFATELESRGITWIYEPERLGKGNYLIDFYLPDLNVWVEVKGRFEPRDNYLLREVAGYLADERGARLFAYTSGKPVLIQGDEFHKISRDEFWSTLIHPKNPDGDKDNGV